MPVSAGGRAVLPFPRSRPRRLATVSVHTSPLDQPGTGDAGGMNVYVLEVSRRLAEMGVAVDVFTRATSSALPPVVEVAPGVLVRHVVAGPYEGLDKTDLPAQLCPFTSGGAAGRGAARAGLVRPGALALLAVRPGRPRRQRPLGGAAGALRAHPGQGQERLPRRRGRARAAGPAARRGPGGRRGRPAGRLHRGRGPPAGAALRRAPRPGRDGAAGRRPGAVPAGRRVRRADPAGGAARCRGAAVRRAHPAAQGARRAAAGGPAAAGAFSGAPPAAPGHGRRRAERERARPARVPAEAGRLAGHRRPGPLRAPGAAGAARGLLPRRRRDRRPQPQRVLRPGGAGVPGVRHPGRRRRRRRPAHRGRGRRVRRCWWTGTTRPTSPPRCPGSSTPRRTGPSCPRGARAHAERFSWQRTAEGLLAAYRGALVTPELAQAVGGA